MKVNMPLVCEGEPQILKTRTGSPFTMLFFTRQKNWASVGPGAAPRAWRYPRRASRWASHLGSGSDPAPSTASTSRSELSASRWCHVRAAGPRAPGGGISGACQRGGAGFLPDWHEWGEVPSGHGGYQIAVPWDSAEL